MYRLLLQIIMNDAEKYAEKNPGLTLACAEIQRHATVQWTYCGDYCRAIEWFGRPLIARRMIVSLECEICKSRIDDLQ